MFKELKGFLSPAIVVVALVAFYGALSARLDRMEARHAAEIAELKTELSSIREGQAGLRASIARLDAGQAALKDAFAAANADTETHIAVVEADLSATRAAVARIDGALVGLVRMAAGARQPGSEPETGPDGPIAAAPREEPETVAPPPDTPSEWFIDPESRVILERPPGEGSEWRTHTPASEWRPGAGLGLTWRPDVGLTWMPGLDPTSTIDGDG